MKHPIRILIADDHKVVRLGLDTMLRYQKEFLVVGEASNGNETLAAAKNLQPDVVILDLMMPGIDGAETAKLLHEALPSSRILILTSFGSSADIARAIDNGASGAIVKDADQDDLLTAIRTLHEGGRFFSPDVRISDDKEHQELKLTARQQDILDSVARGLSNQDIAMQFDISKDMVKHHLSKVFQKLGAATRAEAIAIAIRRNLLKI